MVWAWPRVVNACETRHEREPVIEFGVIVFVQLALLVGVVILREPKLLIPCVVLGLPFEYASTQALDTLGESGTLSLIHI